MLSYLKALKGRRTFKAVAMVVGGTAGAQVITVLASPVLTRLFTPEDFGAFAAFGAVAAIISGVGAMRFEYAIPLAADEAEALHIARLGLLAVAALATAVMALCLLAPKMVEQATGVQAELQVLLPVYMLGFGGATVLGQLAIRRRQYRITAQRKLVQATSAVVGQLAGGFARLGSLGLTLGYAFGQLVAFASLVRVTGILKGRTSTADLTRAARKYKKFPLFLAPSGLLNSVGTHAPILLVVALFGVSVGGWLGLTQRILAAPVGLIGTSLAQVYLGEMAAVHRSGTARGAALFRRVSRLLTGAAVALAVLVALLAPPMFPIIFGEQWRESGLYAQALSFGIAGQLAAAPLSKTLVISGRLNWQFAWDFGRLLATCSAVIVPAVLNAPPLAMVWALGLVQACAYVILWYLCRSAAGGIGHVDGHKLGTTARSPQEGAQ